ELVLFVLGSDGGVCGEWCSDGDGMKHLRPFLGEVKEELEADFQVSLRCYDGDCKSKSLRVRPFSINHYPMRLAFGERDHDVVHKIVKVRERKWMGGVDMPIEARIENNVFAFDFASFSRGSCIENGVTDHFRIFNGREVDSGILIDAIRRGCNGPFGQEHAYTFIGNTKDSSKFLESETYLNIVDDEGDGDRFIKISNETNTFVKLKDKHGANLLVDI
nr:hypothetical protein [Tanacetum cinerariifolium]